MGYKKLLKKYGEAPEILKTANSGQNGRNDGGFGSFGNLNFGNLGGMFANLQNMGAGSSSFSFSSSSTTSSGGGSFSKTETVIRNGRRVTRKIHSDGRVTKASLEEDVNGKRRTISG